MAPAQHGCTRRGAGLDDGRRWPIAQFAQLRERYDAKSIARVQSANYAVNPRHQLGRGVATDLIDNEGSSDVLNVRMPSTGPLSDRHVALEREYEEHRGAVMAMLRADFPRLPDLEELYQEAWAELLTKEAGGETIRHRRALLRTIAWRRAADAVKRRRPDAIDPTSPAFEAAADEQPLPDEQAQVRLDAEALRVVVESLDDQQAAVLKMRFDQHLSAREVQERLGISEKRLEAVVTAAYKKIAAQLEVDDQGETRWTRRQRSLLLACELGIASSRQRHRAQAMVDRDPRCRAMLRAMRSGLGDVAAALPVPALAEQDDRVRRAVGLHGRLDEILAAGRHLAERLTGRGVSESGALEQAGVGGAGLGAGAAAAKVAALCLAGAGAAALCTNAGGVFGGASAPATPRPHARAAATQAIVEPPREHVQVVRLPRARSTRTEARSKSKATHKVVTPVSSPRSRPAASPVPKGTTEFGPGNLGSAPAPREPAAAPQDGGGEFTP